jgi:DNA invertase Pin-like site-specific DNA recombinase
MSSGQLRAAGYVRVSTEEQAREGFSLGAQRTAIERRVEAEGWSLERIYADEGWSGLRADRPDYVAALDDAAAGRFDVLIVWRSDRLGRETVERLTAEAALTRAGVQVVSLTEPTISDDDATAPLLRAIRAGVAEMESRVIGQRTRAGLRAVAESGRPTGGQPPLGYRAVGERGERRWIVDPGEAETVRRIFALYLQGAGVNSIAATLNDSGARTRRGAPFVNRVIAGILDNPAYVGLVRLKGETFPGAHEPILDEATWAEAQALRDARRASASKGRGRPPKGLHLFVRGLLRCGRCGGGMVPKTNPQGHSYYACGRRHTYGPGACDMRTAGREQVDTAFLAFFETHVLDPAGTVAAVREEAGRRVVEAEALADQAERERAEVAAGRARADRAFLTGGIAEKDYRRLVALTDEEGAATAAEAERHRARADQLAAEAAAFDADAEAAERLVRLRQSVAGKLEAAESIAALRAAAEALCAKVELSDRVDGKRELHPYVRGAAWAAASALRLPSKSEATAPSPPGMRDLRARRSRMPGSRAAGEPRPRRGGRRGRQGRA